MSAARPSRVVSWLPLSGPALPICSRNVPSRENFRTCPSPSPFPPIQTLSMWSTKMPCSSFGHS